MNQEMQQLHLAALAAGTAREVRRHGDAEGLLWNAPKARVVQRAMHDGALRNEVHVLLDDAGLPLAWWQRSSGARGAGWTLPYALPHLTLHAVDGEPHGLGVEALIDELAQAAGFSPQAYRQVMNPMRANVRRIQPAAARVSKTAGTVAPSQGAESSVPLSVSLSVC